MAKPVKLTPRQQDILRWIEQSIARDGSAPTRAEIAAAFGFKSPNAAEDHLRALARKGAIELRPGASRGIRLPSPAAAAPPPANRPEVGEVRWLPLIGQVAAGSPILAQAHIQAHHPVGPQTFAQPADYWLRVRGLSMRDAGIWEGDLVAVHATRDAREGQIVVARLGDEVTVKRLRRRPPGWVLEAANPAFDDRFVGPDEPFEIEGVVVGLMRDSGWP